MKQILLVLMMPVLIITAINISRLINGLQARKGTLTEKGERFVLVARAHGFPPDSDSDQITRHGVKVVIGLGLLGILAYFHSTQVV